MWLHLLFIGFPKALIIKASMSWMVAGFRRSVMWCEKSFHVSLSSATTKNLFRCYESAMSAEQALKRFGELGQNRFRRNTVNAPERRSA